MRPTEQPVDGGAEPHGRGHGRRQRGTLRDRIVISTTIIGVAAFVLVALPLLKPHIRTEVEAARDYPERADADRELVRSWLHREYPNSQIRELSWWPPRELEELYRRQLANARDEARDDPQMDDVVDDLEQNGPDRVCRLRYRAPDKKGILITHDDLFVLRDGRVRPYREDGAAYKAAKPYFPDGDARR